MTYRGYLARIEYDDEDEIFFGNLVGIHDGVGFHANTVKDLKAAFHESVDDYVQTCTKIGKEPQKPYSGNLMLRVDPAVHYKAALAAEIAGKSLNLWCEEVLRTAAAKLVDAQRGWQLRAPLSEAEIEHLRKAWEEGLASGPPKPYDLEEVKRHGRERLAELRRN